MKGVEGERAIEIIHHHMGIRSQPLRSMSQTRIEPTLLMGGAVLLGALLFYLVTLDDGPTPRELQVGDLIFIGGELFQKDHAHPVWRWYPASRWLAG